MNNASRVHGHHYFRLLLVFLPVGSALRVLDRLRKEKQINGGYAHHARGVGIASANSNIKDAVSNTTSRRNIPCHIDGVGIVSARIY